MLPHVTKDRSYLSLKKQLFQLALDFRTHSHIDILVLCALSIRFSNPSETALEKCKEKLIKN